MPDSNITKHALAVSLKELMTVVPFSKIRVGDICEKCNMNRKSFYYHFKDKYDLVNWIYYTEFIAVAKKREYCNIWELLLDICGYFYDNKSFYSKILKIEGQNSFSDYFQELLAPVTAEYIKDLFNDTETNSFYVNFFVDGFISAIKRWISDSNAVTSDEFVRLIHSCVYGAAKAPDEFPTDHKK
ncbi:MAG: TetR/AcrR family transcriptional regulator C-terminal domain-containing protein [bacterium]|nr:TetR/AcrR family transcriptional regulator C-terminal domain-containing protein [bacterium]